ncbi:diacylglycerol/lipid kinase family protein [Herbiconiux sp. SYSU D00978]|uniref:diacylglycerol/lipid kinase family protein n=1 Tax=Herbiconiux sp. SYSU D00978 TaxID=2812562 RepID=UPI001A95BF83|nr:diacylglycerol kinase family protein [Herbiconiux sp. SYSU D00978]
MAASSAESQSTRHAAVVYNPVKVDFEALKASVDEHARAAGWGESRFYETSVEDPGGGQTKQAIEEGAAVVMAAGGDGTVRAVAEALRGSNVPIGLLPSGTGNLLARNLKLTLDRLDESVATAFEGVDRAIDLGVATAEREDGSRSEHAFLVMAGLGLDAKMLANTNDDLKAKVGWIAYVDAIVKALRDKNRLRMRVKVDNSAPRVLQAHTILIGNCGLLPANVLLLPDAAVDDGIFDVVALRPEGLMGWLQIWTKVIWENGILRRTEVGRKIMGDRKEVRTLRYMKGKSITLRLERAQEFELDGDAFGHVRALRAVVDPGALKVKVPADSV